MPLIAIGGIAFLVPGIPLRYGVPACITFWVIFTFCVLCFRHSKRRWMRILYFGTMTCVWLIVAWFLVMWAGSGFRSFDLKLWVLIICIVMGVAIGVLAKHVFDVLLSYRRD